MLPHPISQGSTIPYKLHVSYYGDVPQVLCRQGGVLVTRQGDIVVKEGRRVKPNEEAALHLVQRLTDVPVPKVYDSSFTKDAQGKIEEGKISMSVVDGEPLDTIWDYLENDDEFKEHICRHTWELIYRFRQIPKPQEFEHCFQSGADGTASKDVLIDALPDDNPNPLSSDEGPPPTNI